MMKYLEYKLSSSGFVNRFLTVGVFAQERRFPKTVLHGKVNEWVMKESPVHYNPYRIEAIKERNGNTPPYMDLSRLLPGDEIEESTIFLSYTSIMDIT